MGVRVQIHILKQFKKFFIKKGRIIYNLFENVKIVMDLVRRGKTGHVIVWEVKGKHTEVSVNRYSLAFSLRPITTNNSL